MPTGLALLLRWAHFLAGITWIGLLYFFNLINAAFLKSLDGPTKNIVIPKLMPAALNWFRHGATVTVLAGIVLYLYLYQRGGTGAIALGIGGLLGIIMMANVHAIIWPNQRRIIAAVTAAAQGPLRRRKWPSGVGPRFSLPGSTLCYRFPCCYSWEPAATSSKSAHDCRWESPPASPVHFSSKEKSFQVLPFTTRWPIWPILYRAVALSR